MQGALHPAFRKYIRRKSIMIYAWFAVIVIAVVVEIVVPGLVAIWFVPSALVSMVLELLGVPVAVQVVVFLILSVLSIFLSRKFFAGRKRARTNIDSVIEKKAVVLEKIDNVHGTGKVKLDGMEWTARAIDDAVSFDVGDVVIVERVEGVKLIVKI